VHSSRRLVEAFYKAKQQKRYRRKENILYEKETIMSIMVKFSSLSILKVCFIHQNIYLVGYRYAYDCL
jgi:hypothetical protein